MMQTAPAQNLERHFASKAEYLALEEKSKERHEYRNGEVVAMAGGTLEHSRISVNVTTALSIALKKKQCSAFNSDLKVETAASFVYPDVSVVCGPVEFTENRRDTVRNPLLVVEVLSDSTETYDRGDKFAAYRELPSFREYVLVAQDKPSVEVFTKQDEKHWLMTVVTGLDDTVPLASLDVTLSMRDIYDKVVVSGQSSVASVSR